MVAVLGEVGLPDGLNRREQQHKAYKEDVLKHSEFIMRHNQVSQGLTLSFTCPFTQLEEIILSKLCVVLCVHLVNNPASDTHAVENGHIDDGGHSSIVDGLRAVRPHVRTLCQVDVAGRKTGRRQGQERIFNNSVFGRHKLF